MPNVLVDAQALPLLSAAVVNRPTLRASKALNSTVELSLDSSVGVTSATYHLTAKPSGSSAAITTPGQSGPFSASLGPLDVAGGFYSLYVNVDGVLQTIDILVPGGNLPKDPYLDAVVNNRAIVSNAQTFGAKGDGTTNDSAALSTLTGDAHYPSGTYLIGTNTTIGSSATTHQFNQGAILKVAANTTLTVAGRIEASPHQQVFDVSASGSSVVLATAAANPEISPGWFGADATGVAVSDTAINAAILSAAGVSRVVFPEGTYLVHAVTNQAQPRVELAASGQVTIRSPNTLGSSSSQNAVFTFDATCVDALLDGLKILGISTPDAGSVTYSDGTTEALPAPYNPSGSVLGSPYNHRCGVVYQGTGALSCTNVEVTNMPDAGVDVQAGTGRHSFVECNLHHNGRVNLRAFPGVRDSNGKVTQTGSLSIDGGKYNDSFPVAFSSLSYGIDMGGCDFTAISAEFSNNTGTGINNDDSNPSTMTMIGNRFTFGLKNGLQRYPMTYSSVTATNGSPTISIVPFPPHDIFEGLAISIPGVFWQQTNTNAYPDIVSKGTAPPVITITGTATQGIVFLMQTTIPGTLGTWKFKYSTDGGATWISNVTSAATVSVLNSSTNTATGLTLNIATGQSSLDNVWKFDNTWANTVSTNVGAQTATLAKNAQTSSAGGNTQLTFVVQPPSLLLADNGPCQSFIAQSNLFRGANAPYHQLGAMLVKGHEFDPTVYLRTEESQRVVRIESNVFDTFDADAVIQSLIWQAKEIRLQGNTFVNCQGQTFVHDPGVDPFDSVPTFDKKVIAKSIVLKGNSYFDSGRNALTSGGYVEISDERWFYTTSLLANVTPCYSLGTTTGRVGRVVRYNNHVSGAPQSNLFSPDPTSAPVAWSWHVSDREDLADASVDYGYLGINVIVTAGSKVIKLGSTGPFTSRPTNQLLDGATVAVSGITWGSFFLELWNKPSADATAATTTGETVVFVSKETGTVSSVEFIPSANLVASDNDYATIAVARRRGGNSATVATLQTKITGGTGNWTAWTSVVAGSLTNTDVVVGDVLTIAISKTGAGVIVPPGELLVKTVTATGMPNVKIVAVDPTQVAPANVGNPVAVAALHCENGDGSSSLGITMALDRFGNTLPRRFRSRVCVVEGTIGTCTAHATTRAGDFNIDVTDDVTTLCPQQIIKIAGVTFGGADHTEVVDVTGHDGHTGSIVVRDAPDNAVTAAAVSFQAPTIVLCDPLATTDAAGG